MLESIENVISPVVAEAAVIGLVAMWGWFNRKLPEKHRREIEANHRAAFKQAIETGVGLIFDALAAAPAVASFDAVVSTGIEQAKAYVHKSVPEALQHLTPPMSVIEDQIRARLQAEITKRLPGVQVDKLSEMLHAAGVPQAGLPITPDPVPGVYSAQRP